MKKETKKYLNTTIPETLLREVRILAASEGVKVNALLEEALRDLIKKYEKKPRKST
ncbi:MAG: hypothetical protein NTV99_11690 [Deltaproteobacteria bacterium]|nr:hypothetical protein [Deltaproteobacteria bacterium]